MCTLEGYLFSTFSKKFKWFYGNFEKRMVASSRKILLQLVTSVDYLYEEGSKNLEFTTNPTNNNTLKKGAKHVQS